MIFIFPYDVFFFLCCLGMHHYKYEGRESPKTEKNPTKQILRKTSCIAIKTGKKVFRVEKKKLHPGCFWKKITPFKNVLITSNWFLNDIFSLISFSLFAEGEESTTSGKYSCNFFNCFFLFDLFILLPFLPVYLIIFFSAELISQSEQLIKREFWQLNSFRFVNY